MSTINTVVDFLNGQSTAEKIIMSVIVAMSLTALSLPVSVAVGAEISALELAAVSTSYMCTYLFVVQSRSCYVIGVITTILYSILFYQWNLIGSAAVNAYLSIQLLYGWFRWGRDEDTLATSYLDYKWIPAYIGISLITWFGAIVIVQYFGGVMAPWDAGIMLGTIFAQWLLDNKKIETWIVWFAVNVVSIWLYSTQGLYLVAFQYIFFLANTLYGYYSWNRTRLNQWG